MLLVANSLTMIYRTLPSPVAAVTATPAAKASPEQLPDAPDPAPSALLPMPSPVRAPSLVVRQRLLPLGLDDDGVLEVPSRAQDIGRWRDGPLPGDVGPAVLVGHVDLNGRPGVFVGLVRLRSGDLVDVTRPDGRLVRFLVTRTLTFSKEAFPTDAVYEPTEGAELRLITCGGSFNRLTGHYRDNIVVFATAV